MFLNNCKSNSTFLPQTTKWFRYVLTWQQLIFKNFIIFFFSQENNAKETNRRMNIFFILIQFSFLQIKGFFLYNKIPINWYFITNNHSISLLCPKHENKSITYKSCKQIHDQHNKINRFCIFAICIYAKSYKFLYQ